MSMEQKIIEKIKQDGVIEPIATIAFTLLFLSFVVSLLVSKLRISFLLDKNIFYSAYHKCKLQYNDVDPDKKTQPVNQTNQA